ncbi:MAG: hypothetical protein K9G60_10880 [Pseudolabrys sp.]|nr:hypothetical protein [Pseudolabrys sp.]
MPQLPGTIIATLLAAVIAAILPLDNAYACSCARHPTAQGILDHSTAVFLGVAQKSTAARPGYSLTTFKVAESFKGTTTDATVTVLHRNRSTGSCGVKFARGESYTLAARRSENSQHLSTSLCSTWMFNTKFKFSMKIIAELRAARQNLEPPHVISPPPAQGAVSTPNPAGLKDLNTLD